MKKMKGESPNAMANKGPNERWEMNANLTPKGNNETWGAFQPRPPSERPCMHAKTNECDH